MLRKESLRPDQLLVAQMACGAGSGAITKTAIAPLERVKILMQLQVTTGGGRRGCCPSSPFCVCCVCVCLCVCVGVCVCAAVDVWQGMSSGPKKYFTIVGTLRTVAKVSQSVSVLLCGAALCAALSVCH